MEKEITQAAKPFISKPEAKGHTIKQLPGYLLAASCLIWVFHGVDYRALLGHASDINWWWIIPAVVCDISGYVFQGQRWQMLLRHHGPITVKDTTKAIYVGLFTNEILPLRAGELVRTYLVSRWLSIGFFATIPSVIIERLFDSIWLGIVLGITAIVLEEFPEQFLQTADHVGIAILLLTGLFVYLVFFKKNNHSSVQQSEYARWRPIHFIVSFFKQIEVEIHVLAESKLLYLSFLVSSLVLIFQILAFWFVMRGYGLNSSFLVGTGVFLIVRLGTLIPSTPSNVGTYHFLCTTGLMFFNIDKTTACAFSMVVFIIITVPLWAVGLFAVSRIGMPIEQVLGQIRKLVRK